MSWTCLSTCCADGALGAVVVLGAEQAFCIGALFGLVRCWSCWRSCCSGVGAGQPAGGCVDPPVGAAQEGCIGALFGLTMLLSFCRSCCSGVGAGQPAGFGTEVPPVGAVVVGVAAQLFCIGALFGLVRCWSCWRSCSCGVGAGQPAGAAELAICWVWAPATDGAARATRA